MLNRRQFVAGASPLIVAPVLSAQNLKAPARYASRLRMIADGSTTHSYVVYNPAISLNPDPIPDGIEIRVRTEFPHQGRDLLDTRVYLAVAADPFHNPVATIAEFIISVEDIEISDCPPDHTLGFFGTCVATPTMSPFGPLVGRVFSVGCQFQEGDPARFEFLGGYGAGSHATFVPLAEGELSIQRPWHSF